VEISGDMATEIGPMKMIQNIPALKEEMFLKAVQKREESCQDDKGADESNL
jgi:hypothetical protein